MNKVSFFTITNLIKKYDKVMLTYVLGNKDPEIIECTINENIIPKKYRSNNINSNRTRDLGLLDVFDFKNKIWRTLLIPHMRQINAGGKIYKL